jgi:hypothetical protein
MPKWVCNHKILPYPSTVIRLTIFVIFSHISARKVTPLRHLRLTLPVPQSRFSVFLSLSPKYFDVRFFSGHQSVIFLTRPGLLALCLIESRNHGRVAYFRVCFRFADVFPPPLEPYPEISFEVFNHKKPLLMTIHTIQLKNIRTGITIIQCTSSIDTVWQLFVAEAHRN